MGRFTMFVSILTLVATPFIILYILAPGTVQPILDARAAINVKLDRWIDQASGWEKMWVIFVICSLAGLFGAWEKDLRTTLVSRDWPIFSFFGFILLMSLGNFTYVFEVIAAPHRHFEVFFFLLLFILPWLVIRYALSPRPPRSVIRPRRTVEEIRENTERKRAIAEEKIAEKKIQEVDDPQSAQPESRPRNPFWKE